MESEEDRKRIFRECDAIYAEVEDAVNMAQAIADETGSPVLSAHRILVFPRQSDKNCTR